MLGLKLNHVSKRGPCRQVISLKLLVPFLAENWRINKQPLRPFVGLKYIIYAAAWKDLLSAISLLQLWNITHGRGKPSCILKLKGHNFRKESDFQLLLNSLPSGFHVGGKNPQEILKFIQVPIEETSSAGKLTQKHYYQYVHNKKATKNICVIGKVWFNIN